MTMKVGGKSYELGRWHGVITIFVFTDDVRDGDAGWTMGATWHAAWRPANLDRCPDAVKAAWVKWILDGRREDDASNELFPNYVRSQDTLMGRRLLP